MVKVDESTLEHSVFYTFFFDRTFMDFLSGIVDFAKPFARDLLATVIPTQLQDTIGAVVENIAEALPEEMKKNEFVKLGRKIIGRQKQEATESPTTAPTTASALGNIAGDFIKKKMTADKKSAKSEKPSARGTNTMF